MLTSYNIVLDDFNHPETVEINGVPADEISQENSPTGVTGIIRTVFVSDEYIVKIGSINEAFLDIDEEDRQHFAEVVLVDVERQWMIQRRVNCVPLAKYTPADFAILEPLLEKYNINDVSISYGRAHNWTVDLSGTPVIFDYDGCPGYGESDSERCDCTDCRDWSRPEHVDFEEDVLEDDTEE